MFKHESVLLHEACSALVTNPNGIYVDGTFGRGGHSAQILQMLGAKGQLIGFDKDPAAIDCAKQLELQDARFKAIHSGFAALTKSLEQLQIKQINGLLLDLGVSSPQLDDASRGFSFLRDGALDMRMNPNEGESVATWLMQVSIEELTQVLAEYGEERYAKRIAKAIISRRITKPFINTADLAEVIKAAHPKWQVGKHPATKSFQALRIKVNNELDELTQVLTQVIALLASGGRLVVISFHSLEDRLVKQFIAKNSGYEQDIPRRLPIMPKQTQPLLTKIGKYKASADQIKFNPRARSAVMRVAQKV